MFSFKYICKYSDSFNLLMKVTKKGLKNLEPSFMVACILRLFQHLDESFEGCVAEIRYGGDGQTFDLSKFLADCIFHEAE